MKRQFIIAALIFSTMTLINFIGGLVNSNVGHFQGNLSDFFDTMGIVAIFCGLYLLTTIPKIKIDVPYRLPIIRTIFWTLFVTLDLLYRREGVLETVDYILALINGGLCLFYNTILFKVYNGGTGDTYFEIYGLGILLFAVYEYTIIKTSTVLADKLFRQKHQTNVA
jgi:hypothetical protein